MDTERAQLAEQFYKELTKKTKNKRKRSDRNPLDKGLSLNDTPSHLTSTFSNYKSDDDDDDDDKGRDDEYVQPGDLDDVSAGFSSIEREMKNVKTPTESEEDEPPPVPDAPAAPIPPYDSEWSSGVKGKGTKIKKKPASKKRKKSEEASVEEVPHEGGGGGGGGGAAIYKSVPLSQIRLENFRLNHRVTINKNDEIDLDDTSCESSDSDCDPCSSPAFTTRAEDDEFAVRRVKRSNFEDDDIDDKADPLDNEFDFDDEHQRSGVRERIEKSIKQKAKPKQRRKHDRVASQMGRLNNCFLCAWGKRSYDQVNNEHMEKLLKMLYHNIGEIPLEYIAMNMHGFYKNVLKPAAEGRGQVLPRMRSKHFFICLLSHNHIPEIKLQHDLGVMETLQGFLERKVAVQVLGSSDETPVRHLMKELRDTVILKWKLQGLPMNKMAFHRADRDIKLGADRMYFRGIELQKTAPHAGAPLVTKPMKSK